MGLSPLKIQELEIAKNAILKYYESGNRQDLVFAQAEIIHSMEIDYSIKTLSEYNKKIDFIKESHGPNRMLMMLANYYGEQYCNGNAIIIYDDDPRSGKSAHHNKYVFSLKDPNTHNQILPGNPKKENEPYDFNLKFLSQITIYPEGNAEDTTQHAYDSFAGCYQKPVRKLDFKSAFWKKDHEHNVHYIFTIDFDGNLKLLEASTLKEKRFDFISSNTQYFLQEYLKVLDIIRSGKFNYYDWETFILH